MTDIAEHESRFHDQGEQVDDPYPQQSENPLRSGTGKITDATGAPVYVFTEQVHTGAAWANGTAPGQYVGASARDIYGSTTGAVDGFIHFWEQYDQDGMVELACEVGYHKAVAETTADPFIFDFWYDVTGNEAWFNADTTHDYRGRVLKTVAFHDSGSPVDGGSFPEDNVYIYDTNGVARAQANGQVQQRYVNYNAAQTPDVLFIDKAAAPLGDFYLRVDGATGYLQAKTENFANRFQVRGSIDADKQVRAAAAVGIS